MCSRHLRCVSPKFVWSKLIQTCHCHTQTTHRPKPSYPCPPCPASATHGWLPHRWPLATCHAASAAAWGATAVEGSMAQQAPRAQTCGELVQYSWQCSNKNLNTMVIVLFRKVADFELIHWVLYLIGIDSLDNP